MPLSQLFAGRNFDLDAAHAQLGRALAAEGLPWTPKDWTCDSRGAQELALWAETQAVTLHAALYRAYWVGAVDLSDPAALADVAVAEGMGRAEVDAAIAAHAGAAPVDAGWRRSRAAGVTAVPTYTAAGRVVVGAQPYELLVRLVTAAGAVPRLTH